MKSLFNCFYVSLLLFYSTNIHAQKIIRVHDKSTDSWYKIKTGTTEVKFVVMVNNKKKEVAGIIDSIDTTGIYVHKEGRINFEKIKYIRFKDHWENIKVVDAVYYTTTFNLLFYAFYSYVPVYGNPGPGPLVITIPIWAGIIPGTYHLLFYIVRPNLEIHEIDFSSFKIKNTN